MKDTAPYLSARLTDAQMAALRAFPKLRPANPARFEAAVTWGGLWRKLSQHRDALTELETMGIVEQTLSRGEVLWRPTKPLGLEVHRIVADDG